MFNDYFNHVGFISLYYSNSLIVFVMERIVLKVKPETVRGWRMKSREAKPSDIEDLDRLLNFWLNAQEEELWPFLERVLHFRHIQ